VNVAVLGASHGGFTTAADLALAGHAVRLWARSPQALGPLASNPTIALAAEGRAGAGRLALATTDLGQALAGAEIVIAAIPATGHDELARSLAPHVNDRQIIVLTPGTLGSYAIARALARAGARLPFALAETGTLPYLTRKTGPAAVAAPVLATRRGWGYPAPHYELATHYDEARAAEGLYGAGARARLLASGLWSEVVTLQHRYVTEDVAFGLALFESAGRAAGVDTPGISGLLLTFRVLLGRELSGRGRALEHLGLGDFSRREIRGFFDQGWESPIWAKVVR